MFAPVEEDVAEVLIDRVAVASVALASVPEAGREEEEVLLLLLGSVVGSRVEVEVEVDEEVEGWRWASSAEGIWSLDSSIYPTYAKVELVIWGE